MIIRTIRTVATASRYIGLPEANRVYDRWNWHSSRTSVKIRIGLVPPRDHQSYIIVSRYSIPMFSKSAHNPISFRSLTIFLLLLLFLFVFSLSLSLPLCLCSSFLGERTLLNKAGCAKHEETCSFHQGGIIFVLLGIRPTFSQTRRRRSRF